MIQPPPPPPRSPHFSSPLHLGKEWFQFSETWEHVYGGEGKRGGISLYGKGKRGRLLLLFLLFFFPSCNINKFIKGFFFPARLSPLPARKKKRKEVPISGLSKKWLQTILKAQLCNWRILHLSLFSLPHTVCPCMEYYGRPYVRSAHLAIFRKRKESTYMVHGSWGGEKKQNESMHENRRGGH